MQFVLRKLLGRNPRRLSSLLTQPGRVLATVAAVYQFRQPWRTLRCYLRRTCPPERLVETRSGKRIYLSGDVDDMVTLLVVMGRNDYGAIPRGGTVIDVGAHLGAFTLHALFQGARQVYSYEPDPILFQVLSRNVRENGMAERVRAYQAAVVGGAAGELMYYPEGNASGHLGAAGGADGIAVKTTRLEDIILDNGIECVDLLKCDCEGSEYDIIFSTPDEIWRRVRRVRMEYHRGRVDELRTRFAALAFRQIKAQKASVPGVGLLWFDRVE